MANSGLSTKKRAAIRELLKGANYPEAAAAAGVHANTIGIWMKDPAFLEALHLAESEALSAVSRSLVNLADKAATALESTLDNAGAKETVKLRAADIILARLLQVRELADLEERVRRLEEMQICEQNIA